MKRNSGFYRSQTVCVLLLATCSGFCMLLILVSLPKQRGVEQAFGYKASGAG